MSFITVQSIETICRGLSMRISFELSCEQNVESNEETETYYIIDNQKSVEYFFAFSHDKNVDSISTVMNGRIIHMKRSSIITINVKCEIAKLSLDWVCGNGWTQMPLMAIDKYSSNNNKLFYKFDIIVTVIEEKMGTLYAQVYEDKAFTDFNLIGVNGNVAVHKVVLAASSDVFKTMLLGKWKETKQGNIELAGTTQTTLQHLKDFMYLGILPHNELEPLLLLAKCYMMGDLKTKCIEKLKKSFTPDNLYAYLEFACENNLPELAFEILHYTSLHPEIADKAYKIKTATPTVTSPQECPTGSLEAVKRT